MKKLVTGANIKKSIERPMFTARYLKGKIKANLGYRFGHGRSLSPGRVFFALTGRCNLKCSMCPQYNNETFQDVVAHCDEMSINELRTVVDDIATFKPIVIVSGGELFLHKSWHEFLSHIKRRRLFCSIGTNGTMLEKHADKIVEMGIDDVSVSIDGPEEIHDAIRGVPGTYARAVDGVKRVMELRAGSGTAKPVINVIFTITPSNYKHLSQVVTEMESLGVDKLRVGHLNFLTQQAYDAQMPLSKELLGVEQDTSWAGYVTELKDFDAPWLMREIERLRKDTTRKLDVVFFPDFKPDEIEDYYSDRPFQSRSFKNACIVPWDTMVVGPGGEVILCPNYEIGNLREERFRTVWNGDKAQLFRRKIRKMKQMPVCSRGCCFFYT